jgi:hypothetical protein
VLDRAGLAREPAARNGADHVVLALALGDRERLVERVRLRGRRTIDPDVLLFRTCVIVRTVALCEEMSHRDGPGGSMP